MNNIKAIIFDWGWTLFSHDLGAEFPEAEEVLQHCASKGYRLALVSLVTKRYTPDTSRLTRAKQVEQSLLRKYFEFVLVTDDETGKDQALEEAVERFGIPRSEIMIVDDRTIRGIKYGNRLGHSTIWLQKGKFAQELPNEETGQPTHTIHELKEMMLIF